MTMQTPENTSPRPDISLLRISPQDKKKQPTGKWTFMIMVAVVLILTAGGAYHYSTTRGSVIKVATAEQIASGGEKTILNASGYVTPRRRATIASKITGQITDLKVDEGAHVKKGDILARLDDATVKAMMKTLESEVITSEASISEISVNVKNTERNLTRNRELSKTGNITIKQLDDTKAQYDSMVARLSVSQKQLTVSRNRVAEMKQELFNYTITAPFSGIVVSKDAQVGEIVSPSSAGGGYTRTGIVTIVDMDSLEIEVDINESFIAKVKKGQKATATLDAYPDWHIPSRIRTVIPTADRQKATVKVRLSFDALDPKILPDMGVKVSFIEKEAKPGGNANRVRIPAESVQQDGDKTITFVYNNGRVERRPVKQGASEGKTIEILAGIMPGEQVAVGDISKLYDGQRVRLTTDK